MPALEAFFFLVLFCLFPGHFHHFLIHCRHPLLTTMTSLNHHLASDRWFLFKKTPGDRKPGSTTRGGLTAPNRSAQSEAKTPFCLRLQPTRSQNTSREGKKLSDAFCDLKVVHFRSPLSNEEKSRGWKITSEGPAWMWFLAGADECCDGFWITQHGLHLCC